MVAVRKPAARKPAPPAKRTAAAPAKREAAKPAPAPRKAAAARSAAEAKKEQLAGARAARSAHIAEVKEAATKGVDVHPTKKQEVTAHDVLRARHTARVLELQWLQQQGENIAEILEFVAPILSAPIGAPKKSPLTRAKVEPEDRVIDEFYDRDDIEKYSLKELRELATDLAANGVITETKLKTKILAEMEAAGLFREDGSADADEDDIEDDVDEDAEEDVEDDDEESADDNDEDETEDVVYDRDDLKAMSLKELQELAEANEYDWKGLGKAALIDALLADDEEEEESEEEEEDDDDVVGIDPDELPNMDLDELLDLCKQIELKVPVAKRKNKKAVIQMILDELGDEEDDE